MMGSGAEDSKSDVKETGGLRSLLALQLTPHPARVPMKCIGIVGHPLPLGEGLEFLHSPLSPLGERGPGVRGSLANAHSGSIVKN